MGRPTGPSGRVLPVGVKKNNRQASNAVNQVRKAGRKAAHAHTKHKKAIQNYDKLQSKHQKQRFNFYEREKQIEAKQDAVWNQKLQGYRQQIRQDSETRDFYTKTNAKGKQVLHSSPKKKSRLGQALLVVSSWFK